jgi:hypothetical protein
MKRVIVCGAGWAGLNAARNLISSGFEVKVLEKSDRPGGRIKSDQVDGFTLDHGFQVVNPGYSELQETGVLDQVEITPFSKGLELRRGPETIRVGDFRRNLRYLPGDLSRKSGSLLEKLRFLKYLTSSASDVAFGDEMLAVGTFYEETLKPFLAGVFLTNPDEISNRVARELIHWFITGMPGLVKGGVQEISNALAAGLDIDYQIEVEELTSNTVRTSSGKYQADAVILALDPDSSAKLTHKSAPLMSAVVTWYFAAPQGDVMGRHLRVGGIGPLTNTVALSNIESSYAPSGATLIAATALLAANEAQVRSHLSYLWQVEVKDWSLIAKYEIPRALAFHGPGQDLVSPARVETGIYLAGDWRNIPAQQGALLSGRLAATAIRDDLGAR